MGRSERTESESAGGASASRTLDGTGHAERKADNLRLQAIIISSAPSGTSSAVICV